MGISQSVANIWRKKIGKLVVLLVIVCLSLTAFLIYSNQSSNTATNNAAVKTSNPGNASTTQNDLLPVTTTPGIPDTSGVNSPGNSGQNIQSQPDSTPKTTSPQQTAPTTPDQANEPATSTQPTQPSPTPINSRCGVCGGGGGGFRKPAIACPMYCVE